MTDVNTNAADNLNAGAAKEKKPFVVTTAVHARFLASAARKRAEKLRGEASDADAAAVKYDELAATLPESNPSSGGGKARPVIEVGTSVTFRFGRTTSTSKARVLDGVVKARKDGEDGKPEAYKVAVGTGFDEELFTVQPGSILLAGETVEDNEAEAQAEQAPTNSVEGL